MSMLSTILYILNKKGEIDILLLNIIKTKTKFFYVYPSFSRTEFFNKLIALDLLMSWTMKQ